MRAVDGAAPCADIHGHAECAPWCGRDRRWREAGEDRPSQRLALPRYQAGSVPALARAASCRFVAAAADVGRMAGLIWAGVPTLRAAMSSSRWLVVLLKIDTVSVLLVPVTAKFAMTAPLVKLIDDVGGLGPPANSVMKPALSGAMMVRLQNAEAAAISRLLR